MGKLKLPVNAQKTRCLRCPEEPLEFLGYRIGWNYRPTDGSRYIGTRPSRASVQSICRRISEQTARRYQGWRAEEVVGRLNRMMSGWANYFTIGQVSPAYAARRCTLDPAAATVVAAKAKGEEEELRAILQHTAVPQPETPFVDAEVPSVCEGMIPTESRMREIRTSGSTSGGWNRVYGRRSKHRRESVRRTPRTLRAPRQPLTLPLRSGEGWAPPPPLRSPQLAALRRRSRAGARPLPVAARPDGRSPHRHRRRPRIAGRGGGPYRVSHQDALRRSANLRGIEGAESLARALPGTREAWPQRVGWLMTGNGL